MKRWMKIAGGVLGGLLAVGLGLAGYTGQLGDNLREVSSGKLYRSGQMSESSLRDTMQRLKIRSVVNLRGESNEDPWYREELKACEESVVEHADIRLSAMRLPRPGEVRQLIERLERGPYPLLVHCASGSDRAGLASALYLIVVEKRGVREATDAQLTWRYGHIGVGGTRAMDEFFELYLKGGAGKDFKAWALEDYPKLYHE